MDLVTFLKNGFEYDRWANRQWLARLGGFKHMERPLQVLEHILGAQKTWLTRCGVDLEQVTTDQPLERLFGTTADTWIQLIDEVNLDEIIDYTTSAGVKYSQPFAQIALHVINHGTYHRGHLRGLADAEGYQNFPETDLIFYLRERQ